MAHDTGALMTLLNDPAFLEAVRELLARKDEAPPDEGEAHQENELTQRIKHWILLRIKERNAKRQGI